MGACCVEGDAGAPLEQNEITQIEEYLVTIIEYMSEEGKVSVEQAGIFELDIYKNLVTTLINGRECVFTVFRDGIALCAIELAWEADRIPFRKPISCHLYPVRIGRHSIYETINVHHWHVCSDAWCLGSKKEIPLHLFLKDALIRKFGLKWYEELLLVYDHVEK